MASAELLLRHDIYPQHFGISRHHWRSGEDNLTPPDIVRATQGYGSWILSPGAEQAAQKWSWAETPARPGDMVHRLVTGTLMGMGIDVIDLGLSTTPP